MSNVLSEEKKQQVIALGRLGWTLRRIEQATGVRRETAGAYLKAAGIGVRLPGGWGRGAAAKPANGATTDSDPAKPATTVQPDPETPSCKENQETAKPAMEVTTDPGASPSTWRAKTPSEDPTLTYGENKLLFRNVYTIEH